jgi:hypothetical protein
MGRKIRPKNLDSEDFEGRRRRPWDCKRLAPESGGQDEARAAFRRATSCKVLRRAPRPRRGWTGTSDRVPQGENMGNTVQSGRSRSTGEVLRVHQTAQAWPWSARDQPGVWGASVDSGGWREGTDQPYLVGLVDHLVARQPKPGWKLMPLHLKAGGNQQSDWIEVPDRVESFGQIQTVINQLVPGANTLVRGGRFGLTDDRINDLRTELFAYALGMLLGDAGKLGGERARFTSMRMDLQLTLKQTSNERLGEFVAMCLNSVGIEVERVADKAPTGATKNAESLSASYRWISESSPLMAWMFRVCLGLDWNQKTSLDRVKMEWVFEAPRNFRTRLVQGIADSDGSVKNYVVVIASMPNAEFVTSLLQSLGMKTAHTLSEGGMPLRTCLHSVDASELPIFNEIVASYR